jgi:hypothetical protein
MTHYAGAGTADASIELTIQREMPTIVGGTTEDDFKSIAEGGVLDGKLPCLIPAYAAPDRSAGISEVAGKPTIAILPLSTKGIIPYVLKLMKNPRIIEAWSKIPEGVIEIIYGYGCDGDLGGWYPRHGYPVAERTAGGIIVSPDPGGYATGYFNIDSAAGAIQTALALCKSVRLDIELPSPNTYGFLWGNYAGYPGTRTIFGDYDGFAVFKLRTDYPYWRYRFNFAGDNSGDSCLIRSIEFLTTDETQKFTVKQVISGEATLVAKSYQEVTPGVFAWVFDAPTDISNEDTWNFRFEDIPIEGETHILHWSFDDDETGSGSPFNRDFQQGKGELIEGEYVDMPWQVWVTITNSEVGNNWSYRALIKHTPII